MARLAAVPLFLFFLAHPAWAQSSPNFGTSLQRSLHQERPDTSRRHFVLGQSDWQDAGDRISITTEIGPNLTAGVGLYGHKRDKGNLAPVTARDLNMPKSRRAGVGLSLKF